MGIRSHVVAKYVCRYAKSDVAFDFVADKIYRVLTDNHVEIFLSNNDDMNCEWEIGNAAQLQAYIEALKQLPPDDVHQHFKNTDRFDMTNQYMINVFEDWVSHQDAVSGMIHVHWF